MIQSLSIALLFFLVGCSQSDAKTDTEAKIKIEKDQRDELVNKRSFRFAIISDLNGSYGSKEYSSDVKRAVSEIIKPETGIDFVISTGDMVAGQKSNLDYAGMWKAFHSVVTEPLKQTRIPLYPSPGNHDAYISREIERRHYRDSWKAQNMPELSSEFAWVPGVEQNFPFYYAFTMGSALFIALDNTAPRPFDNSSSKWLISVLESQKDKKHKFIYGHIPLLPFAFKKETEYNAIGSSSFLQDIESILEKYKVDAYFSGHSHVYYPGRRAGSTQLISVPLLGGGPRYLITAEQNEPLSQHGFLIVDYSTEAGFSMISLRSDNLTPIEDHDLPERLTMPTSNTGLCRRHCKDFPESMFLDRKERSLYIRHDL